jgi:hypothetical protein
MSPEALTEAVWTNRDRWNRPWSIFRRFWDFKTHLSSFTRLALYLAYNPLYAKESLKKQGMLFGNVDAGRRSTHPVDVRLDWDPDSPTYTDTSQAQPPEIVPELASLTGSVST